MDHTQFQWQCDMPFLSKNDLIFYGYQVFKFYYILPEEEFMKTNEVESCGSRMLK